MANQEIDEVISEKAFEQVERMTKQLTSLEQQIVDFAKGARGAEFDIKGAKNLQDFATSADKANGSLKGLSSTADEYISYNIAAQQALKVWGGTIDQNARLLIQQKVRLAEVNKEIKDYEKSQKDGVQATERYKQRITQLIGEQATLKESTRQLSLNIKQQVKEQIAAGGSTDQLRARLAQLNATYDALSIDVKNGKVGTNLKAEIDKVNIAVTEAEQSTGRFSRNVGNYSAVTQQFGFILGEVPNAGISLRTYLQSISNNLGEFGKAVTEARKSGQSWKDIISELGKSLFSVQGLIIAGTLALTYYASTLTKANSSTAQAEKANKKYADSIKTIEENSRASAFEEIAHMEALTEIASDLNATTKNRERAVKELQKTYPDYFGNLTKEQILQGQVTQAIEDGTKALLARAAAQAAEKKIAAAGEKRYDLLIAERDATKELTQAKKDLEAANKLPATNKDEREAKGLAQYNAIAKGTEAKKSLADIQANIKDADKELKQYGQDLKTFAAEAGQTFFTKDEKGRSAKKPLDLTNETIASENKLAKSLAEISKDEYLLIAEKNKDIFDDEKETLEKRLNALYQYQVNKEKALDIDEKKEIDIVQNSLDKISEIESKSADKRTNEENRLLLDKKAFEAEKKAIINKYAYENAKLESDINEKSRNAIEKNNKEILKADKELVDDRLRGLNDITAAVEKAYTEEFTILVDKLRSGKILIDQYEKDKKSLRLKYDAEAKKQLVEFLTTQIDLLKAQGIDTTRLEEALTNFRKQQYDKDAQNYEDAAKRKANAEKKLRDAVLEIVQTGIDSASAIENNRLEKQLQGLDAKSSEIQYNKDQEIYAIQATQDTEENKIRKIAEAEKKAAAEERALQFQKNQIKNQEARNDRQATLSKIVMTTALKVIESLPNIPLSIAAAALGAVQYATAASAPIPQYAEGVLSHPGGLAWVGDGKENEWIKEPGKPGYWSPATDTLMSLKKGTSVTPMSDIMNTQIGALSPELMASLGMQKREHDSNKALQEGLNDIKNAIVNKQENTFFFNNGDMKHVVKRGNERITYLGKHIFE